MTHIDIRMTELENKNIVTLRCIPAISYLMMYFCNYILVVLVLRHTRSLNLNFGFHIRLFQIDFRFVGYLLTRILARLEDQKPVLTEFRSLLKKVVKIRDETLREVWKRKMDRWGEKEGGLKRESVNEKSSGDDLNEENSTLHEVAEEEEGELISEIEELFKSVEGCVWLLQVRVERVKGVKSQIYHMMGVKSQGGY
jgi:hypothetical protein